MDLGPHLVTLRQLQYAVAVADSLNFRRAAERCHVSQPSLSMQVGQLESVLGVRLFERDPRRVLVTSAGREIVERARLILREADDLVQAARRSGDPLSGTLRIGAIPTIAPYLLPHLAPRLRSAVPRLNLLWVEDKTEALLRSLGAGDLDAALLALEGGLGEVDRAIVGRDRFVLATPEGHPLGVATSPARAEELRAESVLLLEDGHCFGRQVLALCTRTRARDLEFRATSLATLVQMVAGAAGVTLLPGIAVATEVGRARLSIRAFEEPSPGRTIGLVWRKRSPAAPALRRIAKVARAAYRQLDAQGAVREDVGLGS